MVILQTLLIYDISDDKLRNQVQTICKNLGLERVQKSAFWGEMETDRRKLLKERVTRLMQGKADYDIRIYPLCATDSAAVVVLTDAGSAPEPSKLEQMGILII